MPVESESVDLFAAVVATVVFADDAWISGDEPIRASCEIQSLKIKKKIISKQIIQPEA